MNKQTIFYSGMDSMLKKKILPTAADYKYFTIKLHIIHIII